MRERVRDAERLKHILDAIAGIQENMEVYSFEDVKKNSIIFYGFVKYLEIIGEAVYKLTKEFRCEHKDVDWAIIEKMRHVLVHGYYHIQPEQLWETIKTDVPAIKVSIERLYDEEISTRDTFQEPFTPYGDFQTLVIRWSREGIFDFVRKIDVLLVDMSD